MNCKNCGAENADSAKFCVGCGIDLNENKVNTFENVESETVNGALEYKPTSSIVAIIISLFCGCSGMLGAVFAILSIIDGEKVKDYVRQGDFEVAREKLAQAKKWNKISWIVIGVSAVLLALFLLVYSGIFLGIFASEINSL